MKSRAAAAAVFLLTGAVWWPLGVSYERNLVDREKILLQSRLSDMGSILTSVINRRQALLNGLEALVRAKDFRSDVIAEEFPLYAEGIKVNDSSIRVLQIFPPKGGVLVYPEAGNEAVIGRTLNELLADERASIRADLKRTVESRRVTLSDPYDLRQGGRGLVARKAIFRGDSLWGLAVVVLNIEPLLANAGIGSTGIIQSIAIKDHSGVLFYGDAAAFSKDSVSSAVTLPEGAWTLGAPLSEATRGKIAAEATLFRLLGSAVATALAFAAFLLMSRLQTLEGRADDSARLFHEKEEEYRSLFEQSGEGIFVFAPDGRCLNINPSACLMLGYGRAELLALNARDMFDPAEDFGSVASDSVRTYRLRRADGSRLDAEIVWRKHPDGSFQGTARDVTERKREEEQSRRAEAETKRLLDLAERSRRALLSVAEDQKLVEAKLRASEDLLHATGRSAKVGGFEFDPSTGTGTWTEETALIHDLDPSAGTDVSFGLAFYTSESRKKIEGAIRAAVERMEPYDLELELLSAKNKRKWVRTIGKPVVDGGRVVSVRGSFQDITDMRLAVEAIRASEEKFRLLFDMLSDSVFIHSPDGRFKLVNRGALEALGYGEREMSALRVDDIDAPEFKEAIPARIAALKAQGSIVFETVHCSKDGRKIPVEIRAKLIDFQGEPAVLSVARDIGDRKRAEEEIQRANANLESRVAERTAQLEYANREMEAFTYSVSHDLRAPLRAIDGFSRFLEEDFADKLDAEGKRLLGIIRKNTLRMDQLIGDLLNLSRVSRNELRMGQVDMASLAASACAEASPQGGTDSFDIAIGPLPKIFGDSSLLSQVWSNLIGNAFKYSMKAAERRIEIGSWKKPGACIYYVRDRGAGFDPEYSSKLFGAFQRLHSAEEFEGNGVGLAIVQRIVARHGGKVWAESQGRDTGATFYFELPDEGASA